MYYAEISVANKLQHKIINRAVEDVLEDCPYEAQHSWEVPTNPNETHRTILVFHLRRHIDALMDGLENAEEDGEIEFPFNTQTFNNHDEYAEHKGWNDEPDDEDADAQWLENAYGPND